MTRYFRILTMTLAAVMLVLTLGSCAVGNRAKVATCGGYEVLYEEIRFEAMTYRYRNPNASEEEVREAVMQAVKERYAVLALCAEILPELTLDSDELAEVAKADEKEIIESLGGRAEYRKSLKEIYANKHFFRHFLKITIMQAELETALYQGTHLESDGTLLDWWKAGNCTRVTRVAFDERARAEELLAKLNAGETLEELVGSDTLAGSTIDPHYYYYRDLHGSAEEIAALALAETGAISDVVETSDGYCVLVREADDFDTLLYQTSAALNLYREAQVATLIAEKAVAMTFEWNNRGAKLVFGEMK